MKYYCQCKLRKKLDEDRYQIDVGWIPDKFAKIGRCLKIKRDGVWDEGWEVIEVGSRKEIEDVEAGERDFLKQRKVSDV